jgi:serine/threonine protein phosphatase PrpC
MLPPLATIEKFRRAGTETVEDRQDINFKQIHLEKLPRFSMANLDSLKIVSSHQENLSLKQELQLLKNSPEKDYSKGLKSLMSRMSPRKLEPIADTSTTSGTDKQNAQFDRKNEAPYPLLSGKSKKTKNEMKKIITRAGFKTKTFGNSKENNLTSSIIKPNLNGLKGKFLFSVCEGHGPHGKALAQGVKEWIPRIIESSLNVKGDPQNIKGCLENIGSLTLEMMKKSNKEVNFSACSLVTVIILGESLFISNIGRCSAVLANQSFFAQPLCFRHDLQNEKEMKRVKASGGKIMINSQEILVVSSGKGPGFEQTRCLGNLFGKSFGISAKPEIFHVFLGNDDKFVILASAGVWDLLSYQEAVDLCAEGFFLKKTEVCCEAIIKECEARLDMSLKEFHDVSVLVFFINSR